MILEREQLYLLELWSLPPVPSVSLLPGEGGSLPWASALRPPKMIKAASCNLIICLVKLLPSFLLISLQWFCSCKEVKSWAFHEKHFIFFLFFFFARRVTLWGKTAALAICWKFSSFLTKKSDLDVALRWSGKTQEGDQKWPKESVLHKEWGTALCPSACGGAGERFRRQLRDFYRESSFIES